jgi:hypothetical protein
MAIKLAATGVAEFVSATPARRRSILRPYKNTKSGEAAGRGNYYQKALNAIRRFHKNDNDAGIINDTIAALKQTEETTKDKREATKCRHNIRVLEAYLKYFRKRKFKVVPGKKLFCATGSLTVTCSPELNVEDNGERLLIKLYFSEKKPLPMQIPVLLHLFREGALNVGLQIKAKNIVCFDMDGNVSECPANRTAMNKIIEGVAGDIEQVWNGL